MLSDLELAKKLVRWRANPEKIRVSIRRSKFNKRWQVTVTCRATGQFIVCKSLSPERAITRALKLAEKKGYDGIDLGMGWSYRHPWK